MLIRAARLATRHARAVLIAAAIFLVVSGVLGGGVAEHLTGGGFEDPAAESSRASDILEEQFEAGTPNAVLVVTARSGTVDDPDVAAEGQAVTEQLASAEGVRGVISYWSEGNAPPLRSEDGSRALVVGQIEGETDDEVMERIRELGPELRSDGPVASVEVGGIAEFFSEVNTTIEEDLLRAEIIAIPVTLVLLLLIFGSVVSASLPAAVGGMSILGTFLVLRVMVELTDVSIFALNLTTALGLGLAIDYSLFIVSRFREELRAGHEPAVAVTRTVQTAGRTVAFSALTVAASLSALLVFPLVFLRSFAYAGIVVAALAGVFSVVVLPAILGLLGHKVNALTVIRRSVNPPDMGFWHRAARIVMRRPVPIATLVIAVLLVLATPFFGINLALPDDRVLPESSTSRQVGDIIRNEFSSREADTLSVVAPDVDGLEGTADAGVGVGVGVEEQIATYASQLAVLPNVARVDAATGTYCGEGFSAEFGCEPGQLLLAPDSSPRYEGFIRDGGTHLSIVPTVEPSDPESETLLSEIRSAPSPFPVMVTGSAAQYVDTNDALFDRLPLALGIIAVITFVLLFMMFGSVVMPIKAILLNLLSLTAMFGAMVWVFQEGHLAGPLNFTATGGLNAAMPILMFCIAFGLSMDYEVFLLSRIKEEHDSGADNETAVAVGLQRTGRIVTAAAVLMAMIFTSFAVTGNVSFIKMSGVGLSLAVLLDAFVIRGTLVPAFMRLAGHWNWWAPRPLQRVYDRWGISEHVELEGDGDGERSGGGQPDGADGANRGEGETEVTTRETGGPRKHPVTTPR